MKEVKSWSPSDKEGLTIEARVIREKVRQPWNRQRVVDGTRLGLRIFLYAWVLLIPAVLITLVTAPDWRTSWLYAIHFHPLTVTVVSTAWMSSVYRMLRSAHECLDVLALGESVFGGMAITVYVIGNLEYISGVMS